MEPFPITFTNRLTRSSVLILVFTSSLVLFWIAYLCVFYDFLMPLHTISAQSYEKYLEYTSQIGKKSNLFDFFSASSSSFFTPIHVPPCTNSLRFLHYFGTCYPSLSMLSHCHFFTPIHVPSCTNSPCLPPYFGTCLLWLWLVPNTSKIYSKLVHALHISKICCTFAQNFELCVR